MGQHEPYWQTNTSFSPPPSRWDYRFQSEGLPYSLHDGIQLYGSSTSSNGKDSRGWVTGNHLYDLHYSASGGTGIFLSSPSDLSQGPQWTPPAIQEISIDDYETATRKDPSLGITSFTPNKEGTSENPDSGGSVSSQSESSESESTTKSRLSSQRNFSNHRSFISKPIHPLSFPDLTPTREAFDPAVAGFSESDASNPLWSRQLRRLRKMILLALCVSRLEGENSSDQRGGVPRLRNGFPRLRPFCEDGPSRPWGCAQVGDCVEGALHAPPCNAMFLLNRNRSKKNLSLKGNLSKDFHVK